MRSITTGAQSAPKPLGTRMERCRRVIGRHLTHTVSHIPSLINRCGNALCKRALREFELRAPLARRDASELGSVVAVGAFARTTRCVAVARRPATNGLKFT